jgi:hypothetical protein
LREEEEAYYEAKREAARNARLHKQEEARSSATAALVPSAATRKGWVGEDDSDWEV